MMGFKMMQRIAEREMSVDFDCSAVVGIER
jgi:hypothetical protein